MQTANEDIEIISYKINPDGVGGEGGNSFIKQTGMLVKNFEIDP